MTNNDQEKSSRTVKVVRIKIGIKKYAIKVSSEEDENYYQKLAGFIESNMERISSKSGITDFNNLLLLTCLTLADDIFNSPNSNLNFINNYSLKDEKIKSKLVHLLKRIEEQNISNN